MAPLWARQANLGPRLKTPHSPCSSPLTSPWPCSCGNSQWWFLLTDLSGLPFLLLYSRCSLLSGGLWYQGTIWGEKKGEIRSSRIMRAEGSSVDSRVESGIKCTTCTLKLSGGYLMRLFFIYWLFFEWCLTSWLNFHLIMTWKSSLILMPSGLMWIICFTLPSYSSGETSSLILSDHFLNLKYTRESFNGSCVLRSAVSTTCMKQQQHIRDSVIIT